MLYFAKSGVFPQTHSAIHAGIGGGGFLAPQLDRNVVAVGVDVVGTGGKSAQR